MWTVWRFPSGSEEARPKTLQEAVLNAMQEECLRVGERELLKDHKVVHRQIYEIGTETGESNFKVATGTAKPPQARVKDSPVPKKIWESP